VQGETNTARQPFSSHIHELRKRLIYCVLTLLVGTLAGFALHQRIFDILRRPLKQQLYYTSPIGGFNAIIKISIMFGLIICVPVLIYQIHKFLMPAFRSQHSKKQPKYIFSSTVLAAIGVTFAYFVSLPASLHFLTNLNTPGMQPFMVVNDYLNFVFMYLAGFALLFQIPLIMLFINRIKPQKPRKLMSYQRYVILLSFILAAILTPTPDPLNQTLMAVPIILLYQFSVMLVWLKNRKIVARVPAIAATRLVINQTMAQLQTAVPEVHLEPKPQLIMDIIALPRKRPIQRINYA